MLRYSFVMFLSIILVTGCKKNTDEGYGPFKDFFPVTFEYLATTNITPTMIYTSDGVTKEFSIPEREAEIQGNMAVGQRQVEYIKLLGPDQAEIKAKQLDGVTDILLETTYSQSGNTYTFTKDILTYVFKYTSVRFNDTMRMKGISSIIYNNGIRKNKSTVIQAQGYTLADEKAKIAGSDTLYYKEFDLLLKKK